MRLAVLFMIAVSTLASPGGAAEGVERPRLTVESDGSAHELWVRTHAGARLLRRTDSAPRPTGSGTDPGGAAAFVTWTEAGVPWSSYSRNAGRTWSDGRPLRTSLELRAGVTLPGAPMPAARSGLELPGHGRLHLVQLKTVSLPEWRAALEERGAGLVAFLPHHTHLVEVAPDDLPAIRSLDFVERVEPYHPSYRIEPALMSWLDGAPEALENDGGELRVRVLTPRWGPDGKLRIAAAAGALGARVAEYWPSGHVLELWVTRDGLRSIAALDDVLWTDRWSAPETDMDLVRQDAGTDWIETGFGYCGEGVRGEVMNDGVQSTHQDFDGILLHGNASVNSHGTSTYGIVFGNGDRDGDGNAQATGHMPCADAQGIFADFNLVSDRFAHTQELKAAPYFASFQSNSWGHTQTTAYNTYSQEVDDIIWRLDIALVQSQSNTGSQNSRPQAWGKNIISVGGVYHLNNLDPADDSWSNGASIGPAADGRIKPDLHYWYDSIFTTTTTNTYRSTFCCTSAATPQVAGVLGLMVQLWSENVWGTNPAGQTVFERQPHFSTLKALMINNAQQHPFSGTSHDLTRTHQGWGRPSVRLAKERAARSFVLDEEQPLTVGQAVSYPVDVDPAETELKITMVYPDPPGTTSSSLHRINDVDLRVVSPSAVTYHGNVGLDAGNYSTPGGSPNGVDTVENVFILNPEPGTWTVEVEAAEVNQDGHLATAHADVAFALVVTGAVLVGGECGDGVRHPSEDCDGSDLGGAKCGSLGCLGGALSCAPDCTYDTSACTSCPSCDNDGVCDSFENCVLCPGDCAAASTAVCGNDICEIADGEDCVGCPQDCNGQLSGNPTNRYCCGTGVQYAVGCLFAACTANGNTCSDVMAPTSCCGDSTCEGAETLGSCFPDCAAATPGEASAPQNGLLSVTGFDAATGTISLGYASACSATTHVIEYGELTRQNLETYAWSGRECAIGTSGVYDWDVSGLSDSLFFVVVGQDGTSSGSYGLDGDGLERVEDPGGAQCAAPQDLFRRCD